jgi:hypothetical protein
VIVVVGVGAVLLAIGTLGFLWTRALMLVGGDAVDPPDMGYLTDQFRREWRPKQ